MPPASKVQWFDYADEEAWIGACADACADALRVDLAVGRARLLLSGGGTPAPVYRALARYGLDWTRVDLALVDERWLPPGDADSNATLVRENLLRDQATPARLEPILMPDRSLDESVRAANRSARAASVGVYGMGPDGHTASLFPGASGLVEALAAAEPYVSVDAAGCPGAGAWPLRISQTPAGMAQVRRRLLLLRGGAKRELVERALAGDDALQLPVRALFHLPGDPLQIHWCP